MDRPDCKRGQSLDFYVMSPVFSVENEFKSIGYHEDELCFNGVGRIDAAAYVGRPSG